MQGLAEMLAGQPQSGGAQMASGSVEEVVALLQQGMDPQALVEQGFPPELVMEAIEVLEHQMATEQQAAPQGSFSNGLANSLLSQ